MGKYRNPKLEFDMEPERMLVFKLGLEPEPEL